MPIRGPLAIRKYRRNQLSGIDFGRWRSISTINGRLREKEVEGEKREILDLPRFPTRFVARGRFFVGELPSPHAGRRGEKGEGND
ncbi:hypothetical protein BHE74_00040173, partial [Ensete ventricosum]